MAGLTLVAMVNYVSGTGWPVTAKITEHNGMQTFNMVGRAHLLMRQMNKT